MLKGTTEEVRCTAINGAKPPQQLSEEAAHVQGQNRQDELTNRLNAKNKHVKVAVKWRCSVTSISFYKIQTDFSDTEGCGEGKMWPSVLISPFLGLHQHYKKITGMSCSLERTFSTFPDNLLSKDTSCFSFVYTVKAVTMSHTLRRRFCMDFSRTWYKTSFHFQKTKGNKQWPLISF